VQGGEGEERQGKARGGKGKERWRGERKEGEASSAGDPGVYLNFFYNRLWALLWHLCYSGIVYGAFFLTNSS